MSIKKATPPTANLGAAFTEITMNIIPQPAPFGQGTSILDHFFSYLPTRPYCTNALGFLNIRPKEQAAKDAYIQPNPITRAYWLIFDIDKVENRYWWDEDHLPCPNISVINKENGHEHLFYLIDPAVYTLRQARPKPLKLAADVDRYLTRMLDADPGYGKLIAKNPLSARWAVWIWHERPWGLTELLDWIPDKIKKWRPKPNEFIGLGRNCEVFEQSRIYAYCEWRRQKFTDPDRLLSAVYDFAQNINNSFTVPMQPAEVKGIARSIAKWTSRHMDAAGLKAWGQPGREKSIIVRKAKAAGRAEEIRAFKAEHPDMSNRMMAKVLDIPWSTFCRLVD